MTIATAKVIKADLIMEYAWITDVDGHGFQVETESSRFIARRAAGCLLQPAHGDKVIVSIDTNGGCYILSVLERLDECVGNEIALTGRTRFRIEAGGLDVQADGDIHVGSGSGLDLTAPRLEATADKIDVQASTLSIDGENLSIQMKAVKWITDTVDAFLNRVVTRLKSSYRYVDEHEEVQAGSCRYLVDGVMNIQTQNTVHLAEGHIKMDAEQIHLG